MRNKKIWLVIILVISVLFSNSINVFAATKFLSAPTLSCSPTTPTNGNVTVTINYPSNAGVKQFKLGTNGIWTKYSSPVVVTSNTYVYAQYQNNARNWSPIGQVLISNIDKTSPSNPIFSASTTAPTNQNVSVVINFSSDSSVKQYRIGSEGIWTSYVAPVVLSANNTLYSRASDSVGNWTSTVSYSVDNIDKAPPEIPTFSTSSTDTTNQNINVTIYFSSDSLIKQYKLESVGIWTDYTTPVVVSSNDTVYAKASDNAGNWSLEANYTVSNIVPPKMVLGYTVKNSSTDMTSYNSMVANTSVLNKIATANFGIDGYGNISGTAPTDQINYANNNGISPNLVISNNFDSNIAKQLLESSTNRQALKNNILNLLKTYNYKGVDIDIENIPAADRSYFTTFISEIYNALKPLGYEVSVAVPAKTYDSPNAPWNYAFDYKSLSMYSDYLMLMAYDEHYPGGTSGAIASIGWVTNVVDYATTVVPKDKLVLGLAAYGYDWSGTTTKAYSISSCYSLASQYGATVNFDSTTKSKYFNYTLSGTSHTVWFEDGDTIAYKLDLLSSRDLKGIGIWRLGLENANYWGIIKSKLNK